jgi:hypothetical protein
MFATSFPKNHPRENQMTHFIVSILKSQGFSLTRIMELTNGFLKGLRWYIFSIGKDSYADSLTKKHTIRRGQRWKEGDVFEPRIWEGKPYRSKQIGFLPELKVHRVYHFERDMMGIFFLEGQAIEKDIVTEIAHNDGLEWADFVDWFPLGFIGQIIIWDEHLDYNGFIRRYGFPKVEKSDFVCDNFDCKNFGIVTDLEIPRTIHFNCLGCHLTISRFFNNDKFDENGNSRKESDSIK